MTARPRYYRMMRDRNPVGFHLQPSGELHLEPPLKSSLNVIGDQDG